MFRRLFFVTVALALTLALAGCHHNKVKNPIANVDSKQPDKVLFDRAMDAMKHRKYDVARLSLQTLINTYPDSEYIARAKLAVGDSWYAEGGSAGLTQAESEYKDFITFFPNMPEAAEAQMKVADIHYQRMEKPDRDATHAKRAEEEYRQMILQYPDSKLVPQAKQRLREVQEVLAEREFFIGRFYYIRESWAAAIARLQSLADTYPLYSSADEALYMLGDIYERQIAMTRANAGLKEDAKGRMIQDFTKKAEAAYDRILTRYPITPRAGDAKRRLEALKLPVPSATPEAIAANKKEQESREHTGMISRARQNMHKRPDVAEAARVGEPTMVDPEQANAVQIMRHTTDIAMGKSSGADNQSVSIETVGTGAPPASDKVPRSDSGAPAANSTDPNAIPELTPTSSAPAGGSAPAAGDNGNPTPGASATPGQVNDVAQTPEQGTGSQSDTSSSSKKKEKKGFRKIVPF